MGIEELLWERALAAADSATAEDDARARGCLAVAGTQMLHAARQPRHRRIARVFDQGGGMQTAKLAYLNHANLADDSFEVACHPGLGVAPVVLAHARDAPGAADKAYVRAVIVGYEVACSLTRTLMPTAAQRGWRITSLVAPVAAAATYAELTGLRADQAASALGLASTFTGGSVGVVTDSGDSWRFQPAVAAHCGVLAARAAAAGARMSVSVMSGHHSLATHFGSGELAVSRLPGPGRMIHEVTFKKYESAMFGQAVIDAVSSVPDRALPIEAMDLWVSSWILGYGGGDGGGPSSSRGIASVPGIFEGAASTMLGVTDPTNLTVHADESLDALTARVRVRWSDGEERIVSGTGDTSGWGQADFEEYCRSRLGADNPLSAVVAGDVAAGLGAAASAITQAVVAEEPGSGVTSGGRGR